jgi:outer membrane protein OmpA-like peptidoglycan-associated protein
MSSQDDDQQGLVLSLVFGVIALVIALAIGVGIYQSKKTAGASAAKPAAMAAAPAPQDAASAAQTASDAASVKIENGVVKFYFASGKAELAAGANAALADVVKGAQAGRKLVVSGFHDATGGAAQNAELAKLRAFAVRDALKAAGVADEKIELKKPEELKASGSNAEARRVEVTLQ